MQPNRGLFRAAKLAALTTAVSLSFAAWTTPAAAANLEWVGDFETSDFSQYRFKLYGEGEYTTKRIVHAPVRAGNSAGKLTVLGNQNVVNGKERAELVSSPKQLFYWDGPEYWLGFSLMPDNWEAQAHTFVQIHAPNEGRDNPCDYAGNTFTILPDGGADNIETDIAISVIERGGKTPGKGAFSNNVKVWREPLKSNVWHDFVAHFRLSTKGEGFYEVWKDGKLIYSKSGLTNVNHIDSCGNPIPKDKRMHNGVHIGIYSNNLPQFRSVYYDEVRVATGKDGYDLVAPGGTKLITMPSAPYNLKLTVQ